MGGGEWREETGGRDHDGVLILAVVRLGALLSPVMKDASKKEPTAAYVPIPAHLTHSDHS